MECEDTVCTKQDDLNHLCIRLSNITLKLQPYSQPWLGKGIFHTRSHTDLYSGKEKGAHEAGVAFMVDETIERNITISDPGTNCGSYHHLV
jgi:hypothetical protein